MRTILVVDDEPKIVQLARDYLEHAGFAVVTAHDGKAALASARGQRPDLVVLDLGLPELDGLDVARTLRAESNVPIVLPTGRSQESDERAIDAHVKNIRRKLEDDPSAPRYVLTVYGVGYRFAELDE